MRHDIFFGDAQLEIEDIEKLALYPTDVALAKHASAHSPVHVLKRRVIQILQTCVSHDACTNGDVKMLTLLATMIAPRNTRSFAHSSRAMWR